MSRAAVLVLTGFLAVLATAALAWSAAPALQQEPEVRLGQEVTICHETGNGKWVLQSPTPTASSRKMGMAARKLQVVDARSHVVHLRYQTRDIFEVVFELVETNERVVVIASHRPSRRQGRLESQPLPSSAATTHEIRSEVGRVEPLTSSE